MLDNKILDIFYNIIVPEAETGQINCFFMINMAFNLNINNVPISKCQDLNYEGLLIPTLKISNKDLFNSLLVEYVKKALTFYDSENFKFLEDLFYHPTMGENISEEEYRIKYIICTLFANATFDDFLNPIDFLSTRLSMFENHILPNEYTYLGHIKSIDASIYAKEEKSPIKAETPYRLRGYLKFNDGYSLELPEIYAGSDGYKNYLYGVQMTTKPKCEDETTYLKQIRKGYIAKLNGAKEHYFFAVMLFLSLCSDKEIAVTPFLVQRWNAKRIALYKKASNKVISFSEVNKEQYKIQKTITDIMIRYFTKIEDVSEGLEFTSFPLELDSNLHLIIKENFTSRCKAFNELYANVSEYKKEINLSKKLN